jgi:esterase
MGPVDAMASQITEWSGYRFLTVDGASIAYRTAGREDGAPVLLIHAFASQCSSWDKTAAALTSKGYRVIAPDLRGHGRSQWTSTYALEDFERDLAALLDALGFAQVSLVGHSLGGHLALRLAMRMPERISHLVIEAAPVPPRDEVEAALLAASQPTPSWRRSLRLLGIRRLLRLMLLRQFDVRASRSVLRELKAPMPDWWQQLGTITAPCLLLASHDDGAFSERLDLLAAHIPRASTRRLGAGHHLHTEHTTAFVDTVIPFLSRPAMTRREATTLA